MNELSELINAKPRFCIDGHLPRRLHHEALDSCSSRRGSPALGCRDGPRACFGSSDKRTELR
ncbi:MAG: hypothetical protein WBM08_14850, partial [Prochlorococcaceae cyanobacterium]